jgi:hypothetical protein
MIDRPQHFDASGCSGCCIQTETEDKGGLLKKIQEEVQALTSKNNELERYLNLV